MLKGLGAYWKGRLSISDSDLFHHPSKNHGRFGGPPTLIEYQSLRVKGSTVFFLRPFLPFESLLFFPTAMFAGFCICYAVLEIQCWEEGRKWRGEIIYNSVCLTFRSKRISFSCWEKRTGPAVVPGPLIRDLCEARMHVTFNPEPIRRSRGHPSHRRLGGFTVWPIMLIKSGGWSDGGGGFVLGQVQWI